MIYQLKNQTELNVSSEWTTVSREVGDRSKAKINLELRVTCDENYYGNQCSNYCRARDDDHGHFTCSDSGQIRCLHGWKRPETYCRERKCHRLHQLPNFYTLYWIIFLSSLPCSFLLVTKRTSSPTHFIHDHLPHHPSPRLFLSVVLTSTPWAIQAFILKKINNDSRRHLLKNITPIKMLNNKINTNWELILNRFGYSGMFVRMR